MKLAKLFFAFTSLLAASAVGGTTSDTSSIRAAIDQGNAAFAKAYKNADASALADVFDNNGSRFLPGGVVLRGRAAIQADAAGSFKQAGSIAVSIDTVDLWIVEDVAYETGKFTFALQPPGKDKRTITGRYVTSWKKQRDGRWRIWTDMSVPGD